jgi:hypothetical protein
MKLNPQDLETIASLTLVHYNQNAEEFWQGTRDHDVKQNTPFQSSSGECRFNRLGGIHGGKKNAPESSGAITFSGTFSGTLVGARSGAGAGVGAGV